MTRPTPAERAELARRVRQAASTRPAAPRKRKPVRKAKRTRSALEEALARGLRLHGADLPPHVEQYAFCPGRRFRSDFAWPRQRVAVECQGVFGGGAGGHRSLSRTLADYEKWNHYAVLGWRVLFFAAPDLTARRLPGAVERVRQAVRISGEWREEVSMSTTDEGQAMDDPRREAFRQRLAEQMDREGCATLMSAAMMGYELARRDFAQTTPAEFKEVLYQALGRASMAWSELPKGEFDPKACADVAAPILAAFEAVSRERARLSEQEIGLLGSVLLSEFDDKISEGSACENAVRLLREMKRRTHNLEVRDAGGKVLDAALRDLVDHFHDEHKGILPDGPLGDLLSKAVDALRVGENCGWYEQRPTASA